MNEKLINKKKISLSVTKDKVGYSAGGKVKGGYILTQADTFDKLKENILEVVNLHFEDTGVEYTEEDIDLTLDLSSFFSYYKIINAKALAGKIGMSQTLLSQYVNGLKKPSAQQVKKVVAGIRDLAAELNRLNIA